MQKVEGYHSEEFMELIRKRDKLKEEIFLASQNYFKLMKEMEELGKKIQAQYVKDFYQFGRTN